MLLPTRWRRDDARVSKVRVLLGALAVLVLVALAAGCGLVSDQAKQQAREKIEDRGQQARQEANKKVEAKRQEVRKRVETGQEDLQK
jgi:uncharacterized protein HemX